MSFKRVGLAFTPGGRKRLVELGQLTGLGQTPFMEAILYGITDEEAKTIAARGAELRKKQMAADKDTRRQARKTLNKLSTEELQKLIERSVAE